MADTDPESQVGHPGTYNTMEDNMADHFIKVSDEIWSELGRLQKKYHRDKHSIADDVFALAGDLEAICEMPQAEPSTRAAVLEPTPNELQDLI